MYFFFLDALRKFTISDFPKHTHLRYTLINLIFSYTSIHTSPKYFCASCTSSGCWLKNNVKVWIDKMVKKKNKVINMCPKFVCLGKSLMVNFLSSSQKKKLHIVYPICMAAGLSQNLKSMKIFLYSAGPFELLCLY